MLYKTSIHKRKEKHTQLNNIHQREYSNTHSVTFENSRIHIGSSTSLKERETERVHHYKKECDVIQKAGCMSVSVARDWVWKYFYHKHTLTNMVDRDQST